MDNNNDTTASDELLEDVTGGGDCKITCGCSRKCSQTKVICADGTEIDDPDGDGDEY